MSDDLHVAVAVLRRADGRVLVAERPGWRHQGGGLEFPGGKLDPGETVDTALKRELEEELGICLRRWQPLVRVRHRYPDRNVVLHVGLVEDWTGEPRGVEGQALEWLAPGQLDPDRFPAANRPIVAALRLPARYLVTPEVPESELESVVSGLRAAVHAGVRLLQLRAPGWREAAWSALLRAACDLTDTAEARVDVIANTADPGWLEYFPSLAGIHLNAHAAREFSQRSIPGDRILSCACHDAGELRQAERIEADLVVVGHVQATPSHPDEQALGWEGLAALTGETTLPVYAIGGLSPDDLPTARAHGAIGVAGIRGFWKAG